MARPDESPPDTRDIPSAPSKTQRKHTMHALQDLGEALAALDPTRLAHLRLPERLVDALLQVRGIRAHEARRRQMQYIGKLMRDVDPVPVRAALEQWASGTRDDHARFTAVERCRTQLLADDGALDRFVVAHPAVDRALLEQLVRDARVERARGGPPHRYRELFRELDAAVERRNDEVNG